MVGMLCLQCGCWPDALRHLSDGATIARNVNDHLWYGRALECIEACILLLAWAGQDFTVPQVCYLPIDKAGARGSSRGIPTTGTAGVSTQSRAWQWVNSYLS